MNQTQIQANRQQHWEKVSSARPSAFSLPQNRKTNSIRWADHFKQNKFYKPEKLLLNAQKKEDLERHRARQKGLVVSDTESDHEEEFANRVLRQAKTVRQANYTPCENAVVDTQHKFYSCLDQINDFTKPISLMQPPESAI